jgi:hypothetical protein
LRISLHQQARFRQYFLYVGFNFVQVLLRDTFLGNKDVTVVLRHAGKVHLYRLTHQAYGTVTHDAVPHFLACGKTDLDVAYISAAINQTQNFAVDTSAPAVYIVKLFPLCKAVFPRQQGSFFLLSGDVLKPGGPPVLIAFYESRVLCFCFAFSADRFVSFTYTSF